MGILSRLGIGDLLDPIKDLVSEVIVDKDKRIEANIKLAELEDRVNQRIHEQVLAQVDVNKTEAVHSSVFVAGWRPFVGWVGGIGLAYSAIMQPLLNWGSRVWGYTGQLPALDDTALITILGGMLGVGIMRSYDRKQGTATDDFTTNRSDAPAKPTKVNVTEEGAVSVETSSGTTTSPAPVKKKKKVFGIF
jgi:hypothetical protein